MDTTYVEHFPPTQTYEEQVERMIKASDGRIKSWHCMPNHRTQWMTAPRGACVLLDSKRPVFADIFCTNMFQATAIREISAVEVSPQKRRALLEQFKSLIPEASPSPPDLHSPDESWVESLGDHSGYIGLYNRRFRDDRSGRMETKWYLVVRAGLDASALKQLEDHLFDLEEKGTDASTAFLKDPVVMRARNFAARNRQRLLARFATALGVKDCSRVEVTKYNLGMDSSERAQVLETLDEETIDLAIGYIQEAEIKALPFWFQIPSSGVAVRYEPVQGFKFGPVFHHLMQKTTAHPLKSHFLRAVRRAQLKFSASPLTCSITSEHEHYFVQAHGEDLVYYNECCCSTAMGGVLVDQGIARGPIVICGPTTASNASQRHGFSGGGWSNEAFNAYPSTIATIGSKQDKTHAVRTEDVHTFGSRQGSKCELFLTANPSRSQHLTLTEEKLGHLRSQWPDPITLDPHLVFMSALV